MRVEHHGKSPTAPPPVTPSRRRRLAGWLLALLLVGAAAAVAWTRYQAGRDRAEGLRAAEAGRFDEAEPLLRRALERAPDDVELLKALAPDLVAAGRLTEAEPFLSRWAALRADDVERYATVSTEKVFNELGVRRRQPGDGNALQLIDADESKPDGLSITIALEEAPIRKGLVTDADGKPLTGVTAAGLRKNGPPSVLTAPEFTLVGSNPESRRLLLFLHEEKKLGALASVTGAGAEPIAV